MVATCSCCMYQGLQPPISPKYGPAQSLYLLPICRELSTGQAALERYARLYDQHGVRRVR